MFLEQPLQFNFSKILSNKLFNRPSTANDFITWDGSEMVSIATVNMQA